MKSTVILALVAGISAIRLSNPVCNGSPNEQPGVTCQAPSKLNQVEESKLPQCQFGETPADNNCRANLAQAIPRCADSETPANHNCRANLAQAIPRCADSETPANHNCRANLAERPSPASRGLPLEKNEFDGCEPHLPTCKRGQTPQTTECVSRAQVEEAKLPQCQFGETPADNNCRANLAQVDRLPKCADSETPANHNCRANNLAERPSPASRGLPLEKNEFDGCEPHLPTCKRGQTPQNFECVSRAQILPRCQFGETPADNNCRAN